MGAWCRLAIPLGACAAGLLLAALVLVAPLAAEAKRMGGSDHLHHDHHLQRLLLRDHGARHDLHARLLESLKGHREDHHFGRRFDPPDWLDYRLGHQLAKQHGWKLKQLVRRHFRRSPHHHGHGGQSGINVIPEPSTLLLLAGGLGVLAAGHRRRR